MPTVAVKKKYKYNKNTGWILTMLGILGVSGGGLLFFNIINMGWPEYYHGLYIIMILGGVLSLLWGAMNIFLHGKEFIHIENVYLPDSESYMETEKPSAGMSWRKKAAAYYWHKRYGRKRI